PVPLPSRSRTDSFTRSPATAAKCSERRSAKSGQPRFSHTVATTPMPAATSAEAKYHANSLRRREIVLAEDAARPEDTRATEVAKLSISPAPRFAAGAAR